jgi:tetratricopeptide (TPR) repeat protein
MEQAVITQNEANELFKSVGYTGYFTLLGTIAHHRQDYDQAKEYFLKTINQSELLGERTQRADALFKLGLVYLDEGNLEQVRESLEKALEIQNEVGQTWQIVRTLSMLGQVLGQQGDLENAILMFKEALSRAKEIDEFHKSVALMLTAYLFLERIPDVATRLLAIACTKYQTVGLPMRPGIKIKYEQYLAIARSRLDEQAFNTAWAEGEKMEINQAIDYALSQIGEIEKNVEAK